MQVQTPKTLQMAGKDGTQVSVDISKLKLGKTQKAALVKLLADGDHNSLSEREWETVRNLRAVIGGESEAIKLIVRFDWKWVRIDEAPRRYEDVKGRN